MEPEGTATSSGRLRTRSRNLTYILPKNASEAGRLDLQHHILRHALRDLATPLEADVIANILDVGCGTGIWGDEMAQGLPEARVINVDIDPSKRTGAGGMAVRPPNWHFVQGSILQGLPFPDDLFDFTHQRLLVGAIPPSEWPSAIRELIRVTRPGGWIELLELDDTYHDAGPASVRLEGWTDEVFARRGLSTKFIQQLASVAEAAGLRGTQPRLLDLPVGSWDSPWGELLEQDLLNLLDTLRPMIHQQLNVSSADFSSAVEAARAEWAQRRTTFRFHLVRGQA
jgi:SAM-dependent methyltransferase